MRKKRAESLAPGAANLIIVIVLLLSLYILFVPPSEREKILEGGIDRGGDNGNNGGGDDDSLLNESTLLFEQPGRLSFLENKEFEHTIPPFSISKSTEAVELKGIDIIYITHSAGSERSRNVSLGIEELDSLDNVMLAFQIEKASGVLTIQLNGEVIYENDVETEVVDPVKLPKSLLEDDNLLIFSVSEPGWKFWHTNTYRLTDVKVVGDLTDESKQRSTNTFYIPTDEGSNIKTSSLSFLPQCEEIGAGMLDVTVNGIEVYSTVPDCGVANTIQFNPADLFVGTNNVVFHTDGGDYLLEQIKIRIKLDKDASLVYYFDLTEEQMRKIRSGTKDVDLHIEFVDTGKIVEGEYIVNDHRTGFSTDETTLKRSLDAYVQKGGNSLRLIPKSTMDITNLIVTYD